MTKHKHKFLSHLFLCECGEYTIDKSKVSPLPHCYDFRFTFDPQFSGYGDPFVGKAVATFEQAKMQLEIVADYTLHLHEMSLMKDWTNYGFIEQRVDGRWEILEEDES